MPPIPTISVSSPQAEIYTIYCIRTGEDTPFPVKIESNETVGVLKDKIKEKDRLVGVKAKDLELYHIEISDSDNMKQGDMAAAVEQKMSEHPARLSARKKLVDVFKDGMKDETLIVFHVPDIGKSTVHSILLFR